MKTLYYFILLCGFACPVFGQQSVATAPVEGQVKDAGTGKPLAGATVTAHRTGITVATDENGRFSLLIPVFPDTLSISLTGYFTQKTLVTSGKDKLEILLQETMHSLDSVVVSTGYQRIPKERATGSFYTLAGKDLERRVSPNIISRLEGITSGLFFTVNPYTGGHDLAIRGRSTIFANAQPLIVIDNFPYDGDIAGINPDDVEDITVLKDAAAASVWGVKAANGVIVITTKKAHFNQSLQVELNASTIYEEKPDLYYDRNFLNAADFVGVEEALFSKGYYEPDENNTTYPPLSAVTEILIQKRDGLLTAEEADKQLGVLKNRDVRKELGKYFYRPAITQQYGLRLSGGSNSATWNFSAGYMKNTAGEKGSGDSRITLNSSSRFTPVKNLTLTAGLYYALTRVDRDNTVSQLNTGGYAGKGLLPYTALADASDNGLPFLKDYRASFAEGAEEKGFMNWQFYPLEELKMGAYTTRVNKQDTRITAGINYAFAAGLSAEVKYSFEKAGTDNHSLATAASYYARNMANSYASVDEEGKATGFNLPAGGIFDLNTANLVSHNGRAQLNYNYNGHKNSISAIAGFEVRQLKTDANSNRLYGYEDNTATFSPVNPTAYFLLYPSGYYMPVPANVSVSGTLDRFRSYFANAAWTYLDRYTLSASGRIDQSNFFGVKTNQRSVPLWSTGFKWALDKEAFYQLSWLPRLSLRLTYGFNGNLNKTITAYTTAMYYPAYALYTSLPYGIILGPPNPSLKWEKTGIVNMAVDFEMLKNRLSGSIEYYRKKGKDLTGDELLAPSTGYINPNTGATSLRGNFASMKGSGWDVVLRSTITDRSFKWDVNLLFSRAADKVTKFDVPTDIGSLVRYGDGRAGGLLAPMAGKPVYGVYSLKWGGLDPATGDPIGIGKEGASTDYGSLLNPATQDEVVYNGPALPVYFGSLGNSFSWHGFTLWLNFSYKLGYYFRRSSISYDALFNQWTGNADFVNRWQKPGDEKRTNVPSMPDVTNSARDAFYHYSEVLVEKGDHLRLQDISFSYEPQIERLRLPFKQLRISFYANNIGIVWRANKYGIDPDYPVGGIRPPRSYSLALKASF